MMSDMVFFPPNGIANIQFSKGRMVYRTRQEAREELEQTIRDAKEQGFRIDPSFSTEKFFRAYMGIKMDLWNSRKWSSYVSLGGIFGNNVERDGCTIRDIRVIVISNRD
jgi:hypothetical protein